MHLNKYYKFIACMVIVTFCVTSILPPSTSFAQVLPTLPAPGEMVHLSAPITPPTLKGIISNPQKPFDFDFILDHGNEDLSQDALKRESDKLIKYFLASLTMPEKDLWVNLSPYEKDRIIEDEFAQTQMGQELLSQDYLLKQITSSLLYPESALGKKFWDKIYKTAYEKYGVTDVSMDSFNKVWITPDHAKVYEKDGRAFIAESHLKVLMAGESESIAVGAGPRACPIELGHPQGGAPTKIFQDIIIPAIENEVNTGAHFAKLRQIYHSLILATWYKNNLKASILSQHYSNQKKVDGLDADTPVTKEEIYEQYLSAYKQGVYNYIKEDIDPATKQIIPRKYFSGGITIHGQYDIDNALTASRLSLNPTSRVKGTFQKTGDKSMLSESHFLEFLKENALALKAKSEKHSPYWKQHIEKSHDVILKQVENIDDRESVTIVLRSFHPEVPLKQLAEKFDKVNLVSFDQHASLLALQAISPEAKDKSGSLLRDKITVYQKDVTRGAISQLLKSGLEIINQGTDPLEVLKTIAELYESFDVTSLSDDPLALKASYVVSSFCLTQFLGPLVTFVNNAFKEKFSTTIATYSAQPIFQRLFAAKSILQEKIIRQHFKFLSEVVNDDGRVYVSTTTEDWPYFSHFSPEQKFTLTDHVLTFINEWELDVLFGWYEKIAFAEAIAKVQGKVLIGTDNEKVALAKEYLQAFKDVSLSKQKANIFASAFLFMLGVGYFPLDKEVSLMHSLAEKAYEMDSTSRHSLIPGVNVETHFEGLLKPLNSFDQPEQWTWFNEPFVAARGNGMAFTVQAFQLKKSDQAMVVEDLPEDMFEKLADIEMQKVTISAKSKDESLLITEENDMSIKLLRMYAVFKRGYEEKISKYRDAIHNGKEGAPFLESAQDYLDGLDEVIFEARDLGEEVLDFFVSESAPGKTVLDTNNVDRLGDILDVVGGIFRYQKDALPLGKVTLVVNKLQSLRNSSRLAPVMHQEKIDVVLALASNSYDLKPIPSEIQLALDDFSHEIDSNFSLHSDEKKFLANLLRMLRAAIYKYVMKKAKEKLKQNTFRLEKEGEFLMLQEAKKRVEEEINLEEIMNMVIHQVNIELSMWGYLTGMPSDGKITLGPFVLYKIMEDVEAPTSKGPVKVYYVNEYVSVSGKPLQGPLAKTSFNTTNVIVNQSAADLEAEWITSQLQSNEFIYAFPKSRQDFLSGEELEMEKNINSVVASLFDRIFKGKTENEIAEILKESILSQELERAVFKRSFKEEWHKGRNKELEEQLIRLKAIEQSDNPLAAIYLVLQDAISNYVRKDFIYAWPLLNKLFEKDSNYEILREMERAIVHASDDDLRVLARDAYEDFENEWKTSVRIVGDGSEFVADKEAFSKGNDRAMVVGHMGSVPAAPQSEEELLRLMKEEGSIPDISLPLGYDFKNIRKKVAARESLSDDEVMFLVRLAVHESFHQLIAFIEEEPNKKILENKALYLLGKNLHGHCAGIVNVVINLLYAVTKGEGRDLRWGGFLFREDHHGHSFSLLGLGSDGPFYLIDPVIRQFFDREIHHPFGYYLKALAQEMGQEDRLNDLLSQGFVELTDEFATMFLLAKKQTIKYFKEHHRLPQSEDAFIPVDQMPKEETFTIDQLLSEAHAVNSDGAMITSTPQALDPRAKFKELIRQRDGDLNICVVCAANMNRSPMMEMLLKQAFKEREGVNISSAGVNVIDYSRKNQFIADLASTHGVDTEIINSINATSLKQEQAEQATVIIVADKHNKDVIKKKFPKAYDKVFLFNDLVWEPFSGARDVPDPNFENDKSVEVFHKLKTGIDAELIPLIYQGLGEMEEEVDDDSQDEEYLAKLDAESDLGFWLGLYGSGEGLDINTQSNRLRFGNGRLMEIPYPLYIERHGQTPGNIRRIVQGDVDKEHLNQLNDNGIEQVQIGARKLFAELGGQLSEGQKIIVLSSELGRARETANVFVLLVKQKLDIDIKMEIRPFLNELSNGEKENKYIKDVRKESNLLARRHAGDARVAYEGLSPRGNKSESLADLILKIRRGLLEFNNEYQKKYLDEGEKPIVVMVGSAVSLGALRTVLGDKKMLHESGDWIDLRIHKMPNGTPMKFNPDSREFDLLPDVEISDSVVESPAALEVSQIIEKLSSGEIQAQGKVVLPTDSIWGEYMDFADSLSAAINQYCRKHDIDSDGLGVIKQGIEQVVFNAVTHGNRLDKSKKVTVQWEITTDKVKIAITDEGTKVYGSPKRQSDRFEIPVFFEGKQISGKGWSLFNLMKQMNFSIPEIIEDDSGNKMGMKYVFEKTLKDSSIIGNAGSVDPALAMVEDVGGIDFDPKHLDIESVKGDSSLLGTAPFNGSIPALDHIEIRGLVPHIISITPINDLPLLLGLKEEKPLVVSSVKSVETGLKPVSTLCFLRQVC